MLFKRSWHNDDPRKWRSDEGEEEIGWDGRGVKILDRRHRHIDITASAMVKGVCFPFASSNGVFLAMDIILYHTRIGTW